ncbi:hypothetical protein A2U01_0025024, partial [Trifolium medium]|nr:hypothetical protein [Trifolium medium]
MLIPGLMMDIHTFQQKNCNWSIENDIWSSSMLGQLMLSFSIRDSGLPRFKQWNPGDKDLMQIVARADLHVINFLETEKSYATSNALMFASTILNSSTMGILWDLEKFNAWRVVFSYQCCCLRNLLSIYELLNFVYDRGKIWIKSIWVLLMLGHLVARRVIEIIPNLEDKVVYKRVALIGSQLRMVGQNSDTGKYSKVRELGDVAKGVVVAKFVIRGEKRDEKGIQIFSVRNHLVWLR